ncbi:MBL fold metallo-hydrolase [Lacibacter luteus]|uniref:MBL fold metallo-hydrolase n=1 Tax=Lacibacter luteus TaxID=2508719 RepID=A0A4Q1CFS6_9BACT|nr:MBL fold metallo-hydrolase [Lacibacter luteus]RXK58522.1 MBL fold metallo-hydrolase [Lacibacter luteus]
MSYPPIKITFLGTGTSSGVPMIGCDCEVCTSSNKKDNRLRSSIMIETADTTIVVDTTPDFRYQMLRLGVKKIDAIIFTHPHKDHIAGLDDVRAFNYITRKPMEVYCNYLTEEALRRDFYYAFSDTRYPGVPEVNLNTITDQPFMVNELLVEPILVWHMKMPVLGFRFGSFTYITDANFMEPAEKEKVRGSKIMVVNALRKEKHISHYNLDEAVALVQELEVPEAYFTHISHQLGLHDIIEGALPDGIHLAYDGLTLTL